MVITICHGYCCHGDYILLCAQVGLDEMSPVEATYRSLLGKLMQQDSGPLVHAYAAIEGLVKEVDTYVKVCGCGYGVCVCASVHLVHELLLKVTTLLLSPPPPTGVAAVPEPVGHGASQHLRQAGVRHRAMAEAAHGRQVSSHYRVYSRL